MSVCVCVCGLCVCVCLCIPICPCACVCVGDGEGTHTCALQEGVELRGGCQVSCSIAPHSIPLKQIVSLNLEQS